MFDWNVAIIFYGRALPLDIHDFLPTKIEISPHNRQFQLEIFQFDDSTQLTELV